MGWQDAPLVSAPKTPAWQTAPLVGQPAQAPQPAAASSAPVSPSSASPPQNLTYLPDFMNNWNRAFQDTFTFGGADRAHALLTGSDVAKQRAMTQAARDALGPIGSLSADVAGYATGAGELGAAEKIGGALAPWLAKAPLTGSGKWLGGVIGSGVEGAAAGAAGAAGHGQDVTQGAEWGAGLGAAGGTLGGVVGRGGTLPPARPVADIQADMRAAYAPLDAIVFHGPGQIAPALDSVTRTMTGAEKDLAKSTMAKVDKLRDQGVVTGSDVQKYQKLFDNLSKSSNDADREFAPQFSKALEGVMQNTVPYGRNLTPGQGMSLMPGGQFGTHGLAAGDAAAARDAGDVLFGRLQDVNRLADWQANTAVPGGPDVGAQASAWLRSDKGKAFTPPGTTAYEALSNLAATSQDPLTSGKGITYWDLKHHALWPLIGVGSAQVAGALGTFGEGEHHPWWLMPLEDAAGLAAGTMMKGSFAGARARATQRAIDAARVALSTGQPQAPVLPAAQIRDALRNAIFGTRAAGGF